MSVLRDTKPSDFVPFAFVCPSRDRRPFSADRAVMQPFLEARFTQGIVDGGERGSSKGLGPLLDELLAYVKEVRPCLLFAGFFLCVVRDVCSARFGGSPQVSPAGLKVANRG